MRGIPQRLMTALKVVAFVGLVILTLYPWVWAGPTEAERAAAEAERVRLAQVEENERTERLRVKRDRELAEAQDRAKRFAKVEAALKRLEAEGISRDDVKDALEKEIIDEMDRDDVCNDN